MANLSKFVKDYVFMRTLFVYNFLCGVSVGFVGAVLGLYWVPLRPTHFHFPTSLLPTSNLLVTNKYLAS